MTRWGAAAVAALELLLAGPPATAQEQGRLLRVLGETASPPPRGVPARFVIDGWIKDGDDPFKAEVEGWIATLGEEPRGDDVAGACVEARCALSADLGYDKLSLSAELAGPGAPGTGRMLVTDEEGKLLADVQVRFTAVTGAVEGLGELAAPDAIGSLELAELLTWNGASPGFSNAGDGPIEGFERGDLADWQAAEGRPGAGLVLVEDLALLRGQAAAAKARVGWTELQGPGWRAGYPAALLPVAETVGAERRFASADGALRLVIATEPPLGDEAWDAFVDRMTEDQEGVERHGYTRVNDDMEINWSEKGRFTAAAYHSRERGLVRLEFSRPDTDEAAAAEPDLAEILPRALHVEGD